VHHKIQQAIEFELKLLFYKQQINESNIITMHFTIAATTILAMMILLTECEAFAVFPPVVTRTVRGSECTHMVSRPMKADSIYLFAPTAL
jgi:hypothetical protein